METIKNIISGVIEGLVTRKTGGLKGDPQVLLEKVLTKKELEHIKVSYFKKGILNVIVDSSSQLYNLNLHKEDLLDRINKKSLSCFSCDEGAGLDKKSRELLVKDIRFQIGEIK